MAVLLFGIHNHQPVDNFRNVVDTAVNLSYMPFLKAVSEVEEFKFAVHFSGWLLEYIKIRHRELFDLLKRLVERGQVELFTGGFYEPILPSVPSRWRKYQIERLSRFIRDHFGVEPKGLWLAERVWDDCIVPDLVECGIEYVVVDDHHFISAGFERDSLCGYFLTEYGGFGIKVFPIDKELRYMVPFRSPGDIVGYLGKFKGIRVLFDDGEKFGIWPGTHRWVYEEGWLESFLSAVKEGRIELKTFSEVAEEEKPLGIAYLSPVSYPEMGRWALPWKRQLEMDDAERCIGKEAERLLKDGVWKNFFVKYRESNYMHKRMLDLCNSPSKSEEFCDLVARSQCNDVFWHGIFGGLYLPNLRDNFWRYIVRATKILESERGRGEYAEIRDIDFDGYPEGIISTGDLFVVVSSSLGGTVVELSLKDAEFNLQNTLRRRPEHYHFKGEGSRDSRNSAVTIHELARRLDERIKEEMAFDPHERTSFVSHFTLHLTGDAFKREAFEEISDFVDAPFDISLDGSRILLEREGSIGGYPSVLKKVFECRGRRLCFHEEVRTSFPEKLIHVIEVNLHLQDPSGLEISREDGIFVADPSLGKRVSFSFSEPPRDVLWYPVKTVSQREDGFEVIVQGLCVGFLFEFEKEFSINVFLGVEDV